MKYYIICGERSGDIHASNLLKELKKKDPDAIIRGIGGDLLQNEGATLLYHYKNLAVMGFKEVLAGIFKFKQILATCTRDVESFNPDAVIFIDFAGFNMLLASRIQSLKCLKFYYIAPKIWAWNQKRGYKIKRLFDKIYVILPFEPEFFRKFEVQAKYVGNPVCDAVNSFIPDRDFIQKHKIVKTSGIIALLPGSRKQELIHSMPVFREVVRSFPDKTFGISVISSLPQHLYESVINQPNVIPVFEDNYNLLYNSEAAVVTSGTATLETALFDVPQVVVYRTSKVNYSIARRLIRVKYISLVNLVADKVVVKELIQDQFNTANVIEELKQLIDNQSYRESVLKGYQAVRLLLGNVNASKTTAQEISEALNTKRVEYF